MVRKLIVTLSVAAGAAVIARAFNVFDGGLPASAPPPLYGQDEWPALQSSDANAAAVGGRALAVPGVLALRDQCFGARPKPKGCELLAALSTDEAMRGRALRVAAGLLRSTDPERADELLLLAATDSARALAEYGRSAGGEADLPARVQALVEAARSGNAQAATWIVQGYELHDQQQSISQPLWTAMLLHGHAYAIPDTVSSRKWLYSLGTGIEASCPFQAVLFSTASFKRSKQRFAAGMAARTHEELARSVGNEVVGFIRTFTQFGRELFNGDGYAAAAEGLFNRLRHAHHRLNHLSALGTEAGARDAVRVVELVEGCQTAQGVRLVADLADLYGARAGRPLAEPRGEAL